MLIQSIRNKQMTHKVKDSTNFDSGTDITVSAVKVVVFVTLQVIIILELFIDYLITQRVVDNS